MRQYEIYLIDDEIARFYFGKEIKLYQLFLDERLSKEKNQMAIIKKQITYITKRVPIFEIEGKIEDTCRHFKGYDMQNQTHSLHYSNGMSQARLELDSERLTLKSTGDFSAEVTFLEVLRQIDSSFLAIDFKHTRYGWLKPVKNAHFI